MLLSPFLKSSLRLKDFKIQGDRLFQSAKLSKNLSRLRKIRKQQLQIGSNLFALLGISFTENLQFLTSLLLFRWLATVGLNLFCRHFKLHHSLSIALLFLAAPRIHSWDLKCLQTPSTSLSAIEPLCKIPRQIISKPNYLQMRVPTLQSHLLPSMMKKWKIKWRINQIQ